MTTLSKSRIDCFYFVILPLIKNMTADKALKEIKDGGGVAAENILDETKEQILRDALAKTAGTETPPQSAKSA